VKDLTLAVRVKEGGVSVERRTGQEKKEKRRTKVLLHEGVVDTLLDEDSRSGTASLSVVL